MQSAERPIISAPPGSEPTLDLLEKGWLHRLMLVAVVPATWPLARVAVVAALAPVLTVGWWWLLSGDGTVAFHAGLLLAAFIAADAAWLWALPRLGISWGEWRSHVLVLAVPRMLVALVFGMPASLWDMSASTLLLAGAQLTGSVLLVIGSAWEPHRLSMTRLDVAVPGLAAPVRLLHVTDLHVERFSRREAKVLELARTAGAEFIVVTGDYVNLSYVQDPEARAASQRVLRGLQAPFGVYATLGSPPLDERSSMPSFFAELPVRLMRHEALSLDLGSGRRLTLIGLDCSHDLAFDEKVLDELVAAAPTDGPRLLLYHSPELMPQAVAHGLDLYLCGHTHGGQVRLPWYGAILTSSQLGKRYEMGLYREGATHLYVSRGIGLEGLSAPRIRFLCPPELTLVTLLPAGRHQGR